MRNQLRILLMVLVLSVVSSCSDTNVRQARDIGYQPTTVMGRTVWLEDKLLDDPDLTAKVLNRLKIDLEDMENKWPEYAKDATEDTNIWISHEYDENDPYACFYQTRSYLEWVGEPVQKYMGIEIFGARRYLRREAANCGDVIIHEFTHAYHFAPEFEEAMNTRLWEAYSFAYFDETAYREVDHCLTDDTHVAYALFNYYEYFAELTEAYFGNNDYYPHNREELKEYDPFGYRTMVAIWGE